MLLARIRDRTGIVQIEQMHGGPGWRKGARLRTMPLQPAGDWLTKRISFYIHVSFDGQMRRVGGYSDGLKILTFWRFLPIPQGLMRLCAPARRLSGRYVFENGTF